MARDHQRGREKLKDPGRSLSRAVSIFYISAFCLLFLRDFQWQALALAVAVPLAGAFTTGFLPRLFPVDKLLLSLTNFLCALGLLVLYDTNPTYAYHQSIYYFVGLAAMVVCIYLIRVGRNFRLLVWPMMLLSLVLLVLPLFIGKETYGAKNWFYVGGISVQPSEIVKLTLIIVISRFMADRRLIPWLGFSVACLGVLMLQADLGTALLYYGVALMLYFASSGNPVLMLCGMKRQRFKFKLLAFFLFALFALLGTYGMHSIALYGNRWFTYAKNPRVRAQKQNVVPGDILDRSGVVLATSSVSEDGTVTRIYQANEAARRAVVHLLGDSDGQVANGVESFQTAYLYGFQTGIWERIQALVTGQKRHGDNVTLTVDSSLCTTILQSFQRRAPGKAGAAVVMNYKTGEVLGMVSLPTFDPMSSSAVSASSNAYWNRVTQNPYTPGSTFKLVTAAAQLRVNPSAQTMQVNCTGNLTVDGQVIHDYGSASHGAIDLKTAFMRSCNNAFAQYALSMGDKALREAAESFGFNDNFLFRDLVVENSVYPTTSRSNFNIAMSGFGQSAITATPMHLCLLAAAVANRGVMMEPVLIDRVASPSGVTRYTRSSRVYHTAMTEGQAAILAEYMRAVVTSGTGTRAAVSGMIICGKTGSAETSLNGRAITNGLFIGFAQDVPYALCVVVEDIDDGQGGGSTAAPIARDIFAYLKNMQ